MSGVVLAVEEAVEDAAAADTERMSSEDEVESGVIPKDAAEIAARAVALLSEPSTVRSVAMRISASVAYWNADCVRVNASG